jgi:hypothetical protein
VGLVVFYFAGLNREPSFHGRPLSFWLLMAQETWSGKLTQPGWQQTSDAIRETGTNALPYLLEWMAYSRPPWRTQAVAVLKKFPKSIANNQKLERWVAGPGAERADATVWAFKVLRAEAAPIVPALLRLSCDTSRPAVARRAQAALDNLGAAAIRPLAAALSVGKIEYPKAAISWLSEHGRSDTNVTLDVVLRLVGHSDRQVAAEAVRALGVLHSDAPRVVPVLTERLSDRDSSVRSTAAMSLSWFHQQARSAVPALLKALQDSDDMVRYQASHTLENVAPELVPPYGRRRGWRVDRGETETLLAQDLNDPDVGVRMAATNALREIESEPLGRGAHEP